MAPIIAVLDDEARMRQALGRLLRSHGYRVALFESGDAFLSAGADSAFACVLMDLHMPGLNGFGVLEALRARPAQPPVIVLTGHDEPGNAARATGLGARAYLTKPVDEAPLLAAIAGQIAAAPRAAGGPC